MSDLVEDADDALIERAMRDIHHVLYHLFPDRKTTISDNVKKIRHLADCNFIIITRLLYKDCYRHDTLVA